MRTNSRGELSDLWADEEPPRPAWWRSPTPRRALVAAALTLGGFAAGWTTSASRTPAVSFPPGWPLPISAVATTDEEIGPLLHGKARARPDRLELVPPAAEPAQPPRQAG